MMNRPATPALRARMERAVDMLINALDAMDADAADMEDGGDGEPSEVRVIEGVGADWRG